MKFKVIDKRTGKEIDLSEEDFDEAIWAELDPLDELAGSVDGIVMFQDGTIALFCEGMIGPELPSWCEAVME